MHITIPDLDETSVRFGAMIAAAYICGEGCDDEQRVMAVAACLSEWVDNGSVELHSNFSEE